MKGERRSGVSGLEWPAFTRWPLLENLTSAPRERQEKSTERAKAGFSSSESSVQHQASKSALTTNSQAQTQIKSNFMSLRVNSWIMFSLRRASLQVIRIPFLHHQFCD